MRTALRSLFVLVAGLAITSMASADDTPAAKGPHGGVVVDSKPYQFEVVTSTTGVTVYPLTTDGKALDASKLTGTAAIYAPKSSRSWFSGELKATPASLSIKKDLAKSPAQGGKLTLRIAGLPAPAQPAAEFAVPFAPVAAPVLKVSKSTQADAAAIAAQKTCPISGEDLVGMGSPFKISRGDLAVFVCCEGCLAKVKANPDKYLSAATPAPAASSTAPHQH